MGAVTSLMHADRDPSIAGLVLDSPFSSLRQLAEDLCKQHTKIPKFIMSGALAMIKSTISSKAKFDINDLNPLKNHVSKAFIPALFIAGKEDTFISPDHTKALHKEYAGDKNLIIVEGDHNSPRPQFMLDSVVEYMVPQSGSKSKSESQSSIPDFDSHKMGQRKVGNHGDVQNALYQMDENDEEFEEQMKKALEESMKIPESNQNPQNKDQQIGSLNKQFNLLNLDKPQFNKQPNKSDGDELNNDIQDNVDWLGEEEEKNNDLLDDNFIADQNNQSNKNNQSHQQPTQHQQNHNNQSNQNANIQNNNHNRVNVNNNNNNNQNHLAEYFKDY